MLKLAGEFKGAAIRQHARRVNAHFQPLLDQMRPGQYISDLPQYGTTNFKLSEDTLYAGVFVAARDMVIDRLAVNITTAAGEGMQARLGIYEGEGLYPGKLIADGDTLETDGTGTRYVELARVLNKGYYFLAVLAQAEVTCRYLRVSQSPLGLYATFTSVFTGFAAACPWGDLPAQFPEGATATNVARLVCARLDQVL